MLRIVPDVNVLVSSALYATGPSGRIRKAWIQGKLDMIVAESIIEDVDAVLHRPHIQKKYLLPEEVIQEFLTTLRKRCMIAPTVLSLEAVPNDPDDNVIIIAAVEMQADYIISGDPHLKNLRSYADIPILSPAEFVNQEKIP